MVRTRFVEVNHVAHQAESCDRVDPARDGWNLGVSSTSRANAGNVGSGLDLVAPTVIAGSDLGFRVESIKDNVPVGTIVVRIDGRWVNAQVGGGGIVVADAR